MIKMKKVDLKFFNLSINFVEKDKDLKILFSKFEKRYKTFFDKIQLKVSNYYKKDDLIYEANINGFLSSNVQKS